MTLRGPRVQIPSSPLFVRADCPVACRSPPCVSPAGPAPEACGPRAACFLRTASSGRRLQADRVGREPDGRLPPGGHRRGPRSRPRRQGGNCKRGVAPGRVFRRSGAWRRQYPVSGRARRGARGPLYRKPPTCRADYSSAAFVRSGSPRQAAWMVGSCATRSHEPGQAREGAAVSGVPGVPQGGPAGAGYRVSAGRSRVNDEVHGPIPLVLLRRAVLMSTLRRIDSVAWRTRGSALTTAAPH